MNHRVCAVSDVPEGTAARYEVDGEFIAVVHTQGEFFAVSDYCSHAEVSLSDGEVDGCSIECWLHGSRFDLRTGVPSGPPATRPIQTYPVTVDGDAVRVQIS
jgi:3-phenylpropionate/trans-cinnamate dioxygenase ferredoxin subunit